MNGGAAGHHEAAAARGGEERSGAGGGQGTDRGPVGVRRAQPVPWGRQRPLLGQLLLRGRAPSRVSAGASLGGVRGKRDFALLR